MTDAPTQPLNFNDGSLFDDPWDMYTWLRENDPIHRDEANNLWVITRYDDVFHISRTPELYCNGQGVRPVIAGDMSIITLDGEEHIRTRRLINQGFTPRQVRDLEPRIRAISNELLDALADVPEFDFVEDFAIHVPLIIIAELLGLDPETRHKMYRWSDAMMDGDGHSAADDPVLLRAAEAFGEYVEVLIELIAERRAESRDDLIGVLTRAMDQGALSRDTIALQGISEDQQQRILAEKAGLDDAELLSFLTVLLVAGNETTRNAISGGMLALSRFPEQKAKMVENLDNDAFMDLAVDELIRYVTPVLGFIRTVTKDHEYKGVAFKEGDRVLMLYQSANRDASVFDRPDDLILDRNPNPHLAFGIGPHFCLGANLARLEVKAVFQELLKRFPDIEIDTTKEIPRADSTLVVALQHMDARHGCPAHDAAGAGGGA